MPPAKITTLPLLDAWMPKNCWPGWLFLASCAVSMSNARAVNALLIEISMLPIQIRAYPPPDSSLMVRRLAGWRHVLCCAPSYLERHPAPRSPADLVYHNCLRYAFYPFGDDWHFIDPAGKTGGWWLCASRETL